jgi:hypothetical protein
VYGIDTFNPGFRPICVVKGDMSAAKKGIKIALTSEGIAFLLECKIAITFGSTEWKACLVWKENVLRLLSLSVVSTYFPLI